jgi:hypothetical protein
MDIRPPLAWRPVAAVSGALVALLLLTSGGYGHHRDELYFRALSEHPAWGYVDQPPLTPLLAGLSRAVFGDTLTGLRVLPALAAGLLVVLVALVARELGGRGAAQTLAAFGTAGGVYTLIGGHTLLTVSFDLPFWLAAILFTVRALLREQPRWWLAVGAVAGLATYNKLLIALLFAALAAGLLAVGPRRVLASPWLWAGALVAAVLAAPNLLYQVTNDWPQLAMAEALSADEGDEMRVLFVPMQVLLYGPVVAVIGAFGWWRLWRDRRLRAAAVAYPVAAVVTLVSGGRFDYTGGLILLLFAAGCVAAEAAGADRPRSAGIALGCNAVGGVLLALPLVPLTVLGSTPIPAINEVARESVGWPQFTAAVRGVLDTLPPEVAETAITPLEGKSLVPAFADRPLDRDIYWEHEGNRAVRSGDWKLVAKGPDGKWELYNIADDRVEANDLADRHPDRVKEMTAKWEAWATRAKVIPWIWKPEYKPSEK